MKYGECDCGLSQSILLFEFILKKERNKTYIKMKKTLLCICLLALSLGANAQDNHGYGIDDSRFKSLAEEVAHLSFALNLERYVRVLAVLRTISRIEKSDNCRRNFLNQCIETS